MKKEKIEEQSGGGGGETKTVTKVQRPKVEIKFKQFSEKEGTKLVAKTNKGKVKAS